MSDVKQSLLDFLDDIAVKLEYVNYNVTVKAISSGGANCTAELFLATITASGKEDVELFAKVPNIGQALRDKIPMGRLFKVERVFYTEVLEIYKTIEDELEVPSREKFVTPKFYGCNDKLYEETIVLENLIPKGYIVYDRLKSINWEYAAEAMRQLGKLHALSFAFAENNPEEFKKWQDELKCNFMGEESDENDKMLKETWDGMLATALSAVTEVNQERLKKFTDTINATIMRKYWNPLRRPVLVHGDYRASNLMHKTSSDGSLEVVIIDYQTLQAGCPIMDLLYFIFNCSDEEFRRKHFDELVEHYYSQLCLALRRLHVDPEKAYPREDFDYELKEMLPFGLTIGLFTLQIVTVEAANAPKLDAGLAEFNVKTSDLFAERLNGIVNDYIRWGII